MVLYGVGRTNGHTCRKNAFSSWAAETRSGRGVHGAFDRACWIGPAKEATLPPTAGGDSRFAERVCRSLHWSPCDILLAVLAYGGFVTACNGLAYGPFFLGTEDARIDDNLALRWAAENGHVAVLNRLAAPPYPLGTR